MDKLYISEIINIWFWLFLIAFLYILYLEHTRKSLSFETALRYLKKSLIRLIVFYQNYYDPTDQVHLIKEWLNSIDVKKIPKQQLELFKDFVNSLGQESK